VVGLEGYPCCRLQPATRIPLQPSHTETPTHVETRTNNQCGDTIEKSQAPHDGCINVRNMLSIGKAVPLQAWNGPESSRKLRFPDFVTTAQEGGRLSALRTGCL